MAKMVTDDLPAGEDDNPNMMVQALGPSKSFGSKSLGEGDKTGVQVRQNPSSQGFPWVAHTFP